MGVDYSWTESSTDVGATQNAEILKRNIDPNTQIDSGLDNSNKCFQLHFIQTGCALSRIIVQRIKPDRKCLPGLSIAKTTIKYVQTDRPRAEACLCSDTPTVGTTNASSSLSTFPPFPSFVDPQDCARHSGQSNEICETQRLCLENALEWREVDD